VRARDPAFAHVVRAWTCKMLGRRSQQVHRASWPSAARNSSNECPPGRRPKLRPSRWLRVWGRVRFLFRRFCSSAFFVRLSGR